MSSLMNCPACQGAIALPEGQLERLLCPHCHSELVLHLGAAAKTASTVAASESHIDLKPPVQVAPTPRAPGKPAAPLAVAKRQTAERPSLMGQLIGIMGGGVLGMVMGYYLLNYFGGSRYDFLHLPLPGVAHTQPGWLDPGKAPESPVVSAAVATPPPALPLASLPANLPSAALEEESPPPFASVSPAVAKRAFQFPSYSPEVLGQALANAHAAIGCETCRSTGFVKRIVVTGVTEVDGRPIENKVERRMPCEACQGKPASKITPESYEKLCLLAQAVTFVDMSAKDPQHAARKEAIEAVFADAVGGREKQSEVGRFGGFALKAERRAVDGILLAGTVQEIERSGRYWRMRMVLFGLPETADVYSHAKAPFLPGERILLAGSVVDDPRQNLPDFSDPATRIVWGGLPVKLPKE